VTHTSSHQKWLSSYAPASLLYCGASTALAEEVLPARHELALLEGSSVVCQEFVGSRRERCSVSSRRRGQGDPPQKAEVLEVCRSAPQHQPTKPRDAKVAGFRAGGSQVLQPARRQRSDVTDGGGLARRDCVAGGVAKTQPSTRYYRLRQPSSWHS